MRCKRHRSQTLEIFRRFVEYRGTDSPSLLVESCLDMASGLASCQGEFVEHDVMVPGV
jgi:hypothetical protein